MWGCTILWRCTAVWGCSIAGMHYSECPALSGSFVSPLAQCSELLSPHSAQCTVHSAHMHTKADSALHHTSFHYIIKCASQLRGLNKIVFCFQCTAIHPIVPPLCTLDCTMHCTALQCTALHLHCTTPTLPPTLPPTADDNHWDDLDFLDRLLPTY